MRITIAEEISGLSIIGSLLTRVISYPARTSSSYLFLVVANGNVEYHIVLYLSRSFWEGDFFFYLVIYVFLVGLFVGMHHV